MTTITIKDLANADIALTKINQDAYSGEFFKRVGNTEYRLKVRHLQETVKAGNPVMARHNVDLTVTVFSTDGTPPVVYQQYFVLRNPLSQPDVNSQYLSNGIRSLLEDSDIQKLLAWETDLVGLS
nr:MAG: putative coat protein [Leviviridae sp.]